MPPNSLDFKLKQHRILTLLIAFCLFSLAVRAQNQDLIDRADSSFAVGDYAQLLADCDAAIPEFPDSAFLYYYRGVARFTFGENKGAKEDLNQAIDLESSYAEAYVARARLFYATGDRESAYKDLRACLKRDPTLLEAYLLRAEMYLDENILTEAWADLEHAKRLAPRDPELFCLRSEYFLIFGDPRQAIKEAGTAIKLAPDAAMGYAAQAAALEAGGDLEGAKSDIDLAIQLEPEEYGFLASRAMILDAMGQREEALKDLERYISKDSLAWDAYLTRAWLMLRDTNWVAAEADLLAALKIQPDQPDILDQLGFLYILSGKFEKAKATLEPLIQVDAEHAFARANLAYALLKLGNAEAALKEVQQAIKLDEGEPRCFFYRAAIYHELKKPTKACEDLQTAKELGFIEFYGESEFNALKKIACD